MPKYYARLRRTPWKSCAEPPQGLVGVVEIASRASIKVGHPFIRYSRFDGDMFCFIGESPREAGRNRGHSPSLATKAARRIYCWRALAEKP